MNPILSDKKQVGRENKDLSRLGLGKHTTTSGETPTISQVKKSQSTSSTQKSIEKYATEQPGPADQPTMRRSDSANLSLPNLSVNPSNLSLSPEVITNILRQLGPQNVAAVNKAFEKATTMGTEASPMTFAERQGLISNVELLKKRGITFENLKECPNLLLSVSVLSQLIEAYPELTKQEMPLNILVENDDDLANLQAFN